MTMKLCSRETVKSSAADGLEQIVQTYLDHNAVNEDRYLQYYRIQESLANAVAKAAMAELPGGGRFSHQWKIPASILTEAKNALLIVDLNIARSFEELHRIVASTIGPISGIGELTIYDTAHRIGAFLGLRPEHVYLHAGVRSGAKALGLDYQAGKLPMSMLPKAFHKLLPEQVEDCLCIYKDDLRALNEARENNEFRT
jgi:hypothetical protein